MYRHRTLAALLLSAATIGLGAGVNTVSAEQRNKRGSAPLQVSSVPVILIFRYDAGRFLP